MYCQMNFIIAFTLEITHYQKPYEKPQFEKKIIELLFRLYIYYLKSLFGFAREKSGSRRAPICDVCM